MIGSTAYSVATGETLITGTKLSTEERLWAAADLVAIGLSAGSAKVLDLAEAGRLSTKAADVVEGGNSLLKVTKHADDVMDAINIGKDVVTGDVQSLVMDAGMVGLSAGLKVRNHTSDTTTVKASESSGKTTHEIIQQKLIEHNITEAEFNRLRATRVVDMTQAEYDMMIDIRNAVPNPTSQTVMQKIIPIEEADNYFGENAWGIRGYITKREDVTSITNIEEAVKGLRLDYDGSKFVDANGNIITDGYVRIEFQTKDTGYIDIPFGNHNGIGLDPDPATGHGFIKSDEFLTPEYKVAGFKELKLEDGAKMYLNIDGDEIPVGEFKDGVFRYLED